MTRKRFIKLQMARGYSRNSAEVMALIARGSGKSYAEAEKAVATGLTLMQAIQPALDSISRALALLGRALRAGVEAFCNTMEGGSEDGSQ